MVFSSADGTDSNRFIVEANWRRQLTDGIGQVFTPFGRLRGDVYSLDNPGVLELGGTEDISNAELNSSLASNRDNGTIWRGNAVAGLEYRYPFVTTTGQITLRSADRAILPVPTRSAISRKSQRRRVIVTTRSCSTSTSSPFDHRTARGRCRLRLHGQLAERHLRPGGRRSKLSGADNEFDNTFYPVGLAAMDYGPARSCS